MYKILLTIIVSSFIVGCGSFTKLTEDPTGVGFDNSRIIEGRIISITNQKKQQDYDKALYKPVINTNKFNDVKFTPQAIIGVLAGLDLHKSNEEMFTFEVLTDDNKIISFKQDNKKQLKFDDEIYLIFSNDKVKVSKKND